MNYQIQNPELAEAIKEANDGRDPDDDKQDDHAKQKKQADVLLSLAAGVELFHSSDGAGYADITINGHRQTLSIKGKVFRRGLARRYYEATKSAPRSEALTSALNVIEAKADFDGDERQVFIRVGAWDGKIYLDLCNHTWQAVEIDAAGWRLIDKPRCGSGAPTECCPCPRL